MLCTSPCSFQLLTERNRRGMKHSSMEDLKMTDGKVTESSKEGAINCLTVLVGLGQYEISYHWTEVSQSVNSFNASLLKGRLPINFEQSS
ncbi:hypothetical protein TNCV_615051 [Trichonephila clavipes]|nr:hypothetical protein TNCV_615051 [Trichonephila clavipes]